jgi:hypothetical protein
MGTPQGGLEKTGKGTHDTSMRYLEQIEQLRSLLNIQDVTSRKLFSI